MRIAVVPGPDAGCWLSELPEDGSGHTPPAWRDDFAASVAAYERAGDVRWVWADTSVVYPVLMRAGVSVRRCHDVALCEALLLGREGRMHEPATLAAAWERLRARGVPGTAGNPGAPGIQVAPGMVAPGIQVAPGIPVVHGTPGTYLGRGERPHGTAAPGPSPGPSPGPAAMRETGRGTSRGGGGRQPALFEPPDPVFPGPRAALTALIAVHAAQRAAIAADPHPQRFALLAAAESAGGLVAAEMGFHGLPWRPDVHDELLTGLLGPRPAPGMRPAVLAGLAARISEAFGGRPVNPDSPAQVLRALAADGFRVPSTRSAVLREVEHPAAPVLLEYKELSRLHAAHGWAWLEEWVSGGRLRPEYVVGGVVSGRWATRGGGALQIPRVLRRAVVADPGWVLVVADAAQLEPRVLAALSGDLALAEAAGTGDLYQALAGAFGGDRGKAKIALLSAMYGGAGGEAGQLLAVLRRRFPRAAQYVEAAARAGEEGRVVRSRLGRTCPPPSAAWRGLTAEPDEEDGGGKAGASVRARGRFTRNFVVQASAADWAVVLLATLRQRLAALTIPNGCGQPPGVTGGSGATAGQPPGATDGTGTGDDEAAARLVFFQHDEVIVHCPEAMAGQVEEVIRQAASEAGRLVFGETPVRFPVSVAVVSCYAEAK